MSIEGLRMNTRKVLCKRIVQVIPRAILHAALLTGVSTSAMAVPFTFDARSLGMGGANVATADLATAAWANPAMLTNQRKGDNFALLIGIGAFLRDDNDLVGDVEDFQSADDRLDAAEQAGDSAAERAALNDMSAILNRLDGKIIAPEATGLLAMGAAFDNWAVAFSARGDVIAGGTVTDLACDLANDPTCTLNRFESEVKSDQFNVLNLEGVLATELGLSFATAFNVADRKLSVGIKPKLVDLKGLSYSESIRTLEAGLDNLDDGTRDLDVGTFSTIDLGFAYEMTDSVRLGLNIRNLLTDEFQLQSNTLNYDTEARLGVAYRNDFMTFAVDYDLIENEPLLANPDFDGLKTRFINVGAEFNAFEFAQFRLGVAKNTATGTTRTAKNPAYTVGMGLWLGFNLDIAATISSNSVGGILQTGFRF